MSSVSQRMRKKLDVKVNIDWLHMVWEELINSSIPLRSMDIAKATGIPRDRIEKIMNTLSGHKIPVYQLGERPTYYAALRYVSHEDMDSLLRDSR